MFAASMIWLYSWKRTEKQHVDSLVPTQQSINFAEALTNVLGGDKVTLEIIQGVDHGTSEFNTKEILKKLLYF